MYDTILVPSDGSEHAVRAAEHGVYLARAFDATVHLLHVVDVQAASGPFDAGGVDEEFLARLEARGENAIDAVADATGDWNRLRTATVRGDTSTAILNYASDHAVDLLAMGTHGRTGIDQYVTGSVTGRVLRLADVPVLTVRATDSAAAADGYDEILIATDGSEPAEAAARHAVSIAERVDARVHAVAVVETDRFGSILDAVRDPELGQRLEAVGERATNGIADRADDAGVDAVTAVREGTPATALLAYADENDVDLLAMGTTGRSGLEDFLLGSTTERVVRRSPVPVLAVDGPDG